MGWNWWPELFWIIPLSLILIYLIALVFGKGLTKGVLSVITSYKSEKTITRGEEDGREKEEREEKA